MRDEFNPHSSQELKQKRWTEQLYSEFCHICYQRDVTLQKPVIEIRDSSSSWGQWDPLTRKITISKVLIEECLWDVVIEILKHEMAHQYVSENLSMTRPHGEEFSKACDRLGVMEFARQASIDVSIPDRDLKSVDEGGKNGGDQRILDKAEKLLALATSSNEHEAALAMKMVQELFSKYNIERIELNKKSNHDYLVLCRNKKRIEAVETSICAILTEFFFVNVLYINRYNAKDCVEYKAIEISGTKSNILVAEYVYHFLFKTVHNIWKEYQKETGASGRQKRSFILGTVEGFRKKLEKNQTVVTQPTRRKKSNSLIVLKDQELYSFCKWRNPKTTSRSFGGGRYDPGSYTDGVGKGKQINLNKPIKRSSGNQGLLLR